MNTIVVSDRPEAPLPSIVVVEEVVVALAVRNHGRLPMRSAQLQSEAGDYSPPFNQRYYSR